MYSCESHHMDEQKQDAQLEPTYSSSVPILDVASRTSQKQWTIERGGERGSEISVRHDDDEMTHETVGLFCVTMVHFDIDPSA